jgi:hypothetical protein
MELDWWYVKDFIDRHNYPLAQRDLEMENFKIQKYHIMNIFGNIVRWLLIMI